MRVTADRPESRPGRRTKVPLRCGPTPVHPAMMDEFGRAVGRVICSADETCSSSRSIPRVGLLAAAETGSLVSFGGRAFAALPDTSDPPLQLDRINRDDTFAGSSVSMIHHEGSAFVPATTLSGSRTTMRRPSTSSTRCPEDGNERSRGRSSTRHLGSVAVQPPERTEPTTSSHSRTTPRTSTCTCSPARAAPAPSCRPPSALRVTGTGRSRWSRTNH